MSTRSDIIAQFANGEWARIYCHSGGYLEHNGRILFEHYTGQKKIERLMRLGDLSILGAGIGKKVDFDLYEKTCRRFHDGEITEAEFNRIKEAIWSQCRAYRRDRGEKGTAAKIGETLAEVWPEQDTWTEFTYVWRDGKWFVGDPDEGTQTLIDLGDALLGKKIITPAVKVPFLGRTILRKPRTYTSRLRKTMANSSLRRSMK